MERHSDYVNLCEDYLLGELSESERSEFEERYFADDAIFAQFLAVKDDLLDAYARGELKGEKRERFERHYLATEARRQKVDESRALIQAASAVSLASTAARITEKHSFLNYFSLHPAATRIALVTATLIIIALAWIAVTQYRLSDDQRADNVGKPSDANNASDEAPTPAPSVNIDGQPSSQSPTPRPEVATQPSPPKSATQIASVTLVPFSARASGSPGVVNLSPETRQVRLNLIFSESSFETFAATIRTVEGDVIARQSNLKARPNGTSRVVTITFDSSLLRRQDFIATLNGRSRDGKLETISEYYFKVDRSSNSVPKNE